MGIDSGKGNRTRERVPRGDLGAESGGKSPELKAENTPATCHGPASKDEAGQHLKMKVYCSSQVVGGAVRDAVRLLGKTRLLLFQLLDCGSRESAIFK